MDFRIEFILTPKKRLFLPPAPLQYTSTLMLVRKILYDKFSETGLVFENGREETFAVTLCSEGYILCRIEDGKLKGHSQSSGVAGPGFHAAVVEFVNTLAKECHCAVEFTDETGYAGCQDFDKLKNEFFIPKLAGVMKLAESADEPGAGIYAFWNPENFLLTEAGKETWISPTGEYRIAEIREYAKNPESFADMFFIWPNKEQDALFFRNSALYKSWMECGFHKTDNAKTIIELLELAAMEDPSVPFPKELYLELCAIEEHEPLDLEPLAEDARFTNIGYRRRPIIQRIDVFSLPLQGSFSFVRHLNEYIFTDDKYNIRTTVISLNAPFQVQDDKLSKESVSTFAEESNGMELKGELFKITEPPEKHFYNFMLKAEITKDRKHLFITISFDDEADYEGAVNLLKSISAADK